MNAPPSQFLSYMPNAQPFLVLIGDDDGSDVVEDDEVDYLEMVRLTRSAGGQHLDHAELNYSLAIAGDRLIDKQVPVNFSRKVQVWLRDNKTGDLLTGGALFSGELAIETAKIDRTGEFCHLTARIEPWHFGDPLLGPKILDTDGLTVLTPDIPIVFNPEIDGKIEANMTPVQEDESIGFNGQFQGGVDNDKSAQAWIDPESARTEPARTLQSALEDGEDPDGDPLLPQLWDLANAVNSLCLACNPDETFVVNPELDDLQKVFGDQPPALRNVLLTRGKRLPELLDELLPRFGFNWFVEPSDDTAGDGEEDGEGDTLCVNYLRVFQLGAGQQKKLFMQKPKSPAQALQVASNSASSAEVGWNIADLANVIVGQGSQKEIEITVELYRGWPESEDSLTADQLIKVDERTDEIDASMSVFPDHRNAWRRWVLNEGGDYCDTRTVVAAIPATPFDLKPLLGSDTVVKRRRFHHCLTYDFELERRDVYVQYRDNSVASDGDPGAWKAFPETWTNVGFHVLEKECGIWFSGAKPPEDLMAIESVNAGSARIRITAVVRGDDRLEATAERQQLSPNLNAIKLFVDLSDRFHYRKIQATGTYASALVNEPFGDDTDDDTDLLQMYVESLQSVEQSARISCELEVFGIQAGYEIGQLITSIDGRNISLNRNSPLQSQPLYPQITGITYDRQNQRTILRVETFDFTAPLLKKLTL